MEIKKKRKEIHTHETATNEGIQTWDVNDVDKINQYTLNVHTVNLQLYMLSFLFSCAFVGNKCEWGFFSFGMENFY